MVCPRFCAPTFLNPRSRARSSWAARAVCARIADQRLRCGSNLEPVCAACTAVDAAATGGHHGHVAAPASRSGSPLQTHNIPH